MYRAVHRERAISCTTTRWRIDAAPVHDYLAGFIASIRLPENWHACAMEVVRDDETTRRQERERATLQAKLVRLKELVKEGIIEPDEYRADKVAIDTQLAAMQHETTTVDVDHAAGQLANLKALWADATDEERRTIVLGIVEAVWVDLDGNRVAAVQPKACTISRASWASKPAEASTIGQSAMQPQSRGSATRFCAHGHVSGREESHAADPPL